MIQRGATPSDTASAHSDPSSSAVPPPDAARVLPTVGEIARAFLSIGCLAFGGQGGLLALLSRDLVQRRGWITEAQITEAFTYVQLLPGAVVVQVVAYLGYRLRGWRGAFVAAACFLLPSVIVMLALAAAYSRMAALSSVAAVFQGLTASVVGLLAVAAWKQARKSVRDGTGAIIALLVCGLSVGAGVNPAVLVVAAGLIGIAREAVGTPGGRLPGGKQANDNTPAGIPTGKPDGKTEAIGTQAAAEAVLAESAAADTNMQGDSRVDRGGTAP